MDKIFMACEIQNNEVRENALEALRDFGTQEYDLLELYFERVCKTTANAARSDDSKVGANAFEFWTTLAEHELSLKQENVHYKRYVENIRDDILQLIFDGLLKIDFDEDDDDEDEWGHAHSATCCLKIMAQLIGNEIQDPVVKYVAMHIQEQDWKKKYAALMALGSITEGPDKKQFANVIVLSLQQLMAMFDDQNPKIRHAIAWVMRKLSEDHAEVLLNPQIIQQFLHRILESLKDKPKISFQCCSSLMWLAKSVE